jgi:replication factor C small subunit
MDGPLWTETHAPPLDELPQPEVRDALGRAVDEPMNLVLHGPQGAGKTAAIRALARETHDDPDHDFVVLNVDDFFSRTKSEISDDPRFSRFLTGRSRLSKRDMINRVLKESASYAPVSGDYKTLLLDNAEAIREDFQQALRRVMERHHRTTRFAIATRQPSRLLPPVRSRCFDVPVRAPTHDEVVAVLERIVEREQVDCDDDGLEYVAGYADGDLRAAILAAQTTAAREDAVTMSAAYEALGDVGVDETVGGMLEAAAEGDFEGARSTLDDLLYDRGYSGEEVLDAVLDAARSRYSGRRLAEIHRLAGEVDFDLAEGSGDRVHLAHLLAELGR